MVPKKSLISAAFAACALAAAASAQSQKGMVKLTAPAKHVNYDVQTGRITKKASEKALIPCLTNTDSSGFFGVGAAPGGVEEWVSICTAPPFPGPSGSGIVGQFTFGYATGANRVNLGGPGGAFRMGFFSGGTAFGGDPTGNLVPPFSFVGLPGSAGGYPAIAGWLVGVNLVGGFEFVMPPAGTTFSYGDSGLDSDGGVYGFGPTWFSGPLLCYAGIPGTTTTAGPDANGQQDVFSAYNPPFSGGAGVLSGLFFFGGQPFNFSSFWLQVLEEDGTCAAQSATSFTGSACGGANAGILTVSGGPIPGQTWTASIDKTGKLGATFAFCFAWAGPAGCVNFGANRKIIVSLAGPELLNPPLGITFFTAGPAGTASFAIPVGTDLSFCGAELTAQGVRFGGGPWDLTNGQDMIIGF